MLITGAPASAPEGLPDLTKVAPEERDRVWFATYYQGDKVPQLTLRAALTGMVIGGVLCLSNIYVTLKTGWSLGVTLTSCILAFAVFRVLGAVGLVRKGFTALENNAMGSVASAAAFMTGGGNMAALPALFLLTGARPGGFAMFAWFYPIISGYPLCCGRPSYQFWMWLHSWR